MMETGSDPTALLKEITSLGKCLPPDLARLVELPPAKRRTLRLELETLVAKLGELGESLDTVRQPRHIFDPTSPKVIGKIVADTLLLQEREGLGVVVGQPFYGAGVYAIYYRGPFPAYLPIRTAEHPIYVGKADPEKIHAATASDQGIRLYTRLKDHERSISKANNIDISDFDCRYLVVRSAWIETAEDLLIDWFKPVWNNEMKICYGFGKHGDSAGTRKNERSPWDTIHPGRPWATSNKNKPNSRSAGQILKDIASHFDAYPPGTRS